MKATRAVGSRCIVFTDLPDVDCLGTVAKLEVEVRYLGGARTGKAVALDELVMPLLTAAPDLLEACKAANLHLAEIAKQGRCLSVDEWCETQQALAAAIDKAEGRA